MDRAGTHLGGFTRREHPVAGLRPTVLFALASALTASYLVFDLWVSSKWRGDLEEAIGPVAAWLVPTFLAYIPAIVIGFLIFTLVFGRYRPTEPRAPGGGWPAVTILIAAWNEHATIAATLAKIAELEYHGPLELVLADNNSSDRTAEAAEVAALQLGLRYRGVFEPVPGKHNALNRALADVTTPILVTVDADTHLHPDALAYLIAAVSDQRKASMSPPVPERSSRTSRRARFSRACRGGTIASASTASSGCRPRTTARSSRRAHSRRTGRKTFAPSAVGRMRSAKTSS